MAATLIASPARTSNVQRRRREETVSARRQRASIARAVAWSSAKARVARLGPESGDIIWRVQLLAPVLVRHGSRGPARMVSLVRCTMPLDAAPHGYRPEIQQKRINCNDNTREKRFSAFRGLFRMQTSPFGQERSAESAAGAGAAPSSLSLSAHKSTAGTRARPRREQALDVHCVLDPSNPSNPSDGAPLDQLCPSMRGCLSLRAASAARTTTTKDATTSDDRSRGRTGH